MAAGTSARGGMGVTIRICIGSRGSWIRRVLVAIVCGRIDVQLRTGPVLVDGGKVVLALRRRRSIVLLLLNLLLLLRLSLLLLPLGRAGRRGIRGLGGKRTGEVVDGREHKR